MLGGSIQDAVDVFGRSVLAEQEHAKVLRYLTLLKEFGTANFRYVVRKDETFSVTLDGDTFDLTGGHASAYVDSNAWEKAFYSAVVLRDGDAINALKEVDETIFASANLKCDEFDLALVKLMQGLFTADGPDADVGTLLEKALIASNPHNIDRGRQPYANQILYPLLPLYRCIFHQVNYLCHHKYQQ